MLLKPRHEAQYHSALKRALRAGLSVLQKGGSSTDAVVAAVVSLEDSPLFNAGRGAVLNERGEHELDAAIMEGRERKAGAVALVRRAKNPGRLARAVMEHTPHVFLGGAGADRLARKYGLEMVPNAYYSTRERLGALERAQLRAKGALRETASAAERHGTVGAVALDANGNLAAATSTGGFTNKMSGRIGDSPVIGAGTYADNATCAVSATGDGEFFIRGVLAAHVSARMRYLRETLAQAAAAALAEVAGLGGRGGLVAVDRRGRLALPFTTEGMYRAYIAANGAVVTRIFR